jgi:dipeptidyl-peptidase 4
MQQATFPSKPVKALFSTLTLLIAGFHVLPAQNTLSLNSIWKEGIFFPRGVAGFNAMNDGNSYSILQKSEIQVFDFTATQPKAVYAFMHESKKLQFESYTLSPSEKQVILCEKSESIYRHSSRGVYHVASLEDRNAQSIHRGQQIMYPTFSPDERFIAFVFENNLYVEDTKNQTTFPITSDGKANSILNGCSDWVYEEEFETVQAFSWSPNSQYLAWLRFDETEVPLFSMDMFLGALYPSQYVFKYPKVGEKNSIVSLWIWDAKSRSVSEIGLPWNYEYLPRFYWIDNQIAAIVLNRLQNDMRVYLATPGEASNTAKQIYRETSDTYVDLPEAFELLPKNQGILMTSERDGYRHLYVLNHTTGNVRQLTSGNWEILHYHGYHEKTNAVYFTSAEESSLEEQLYRIDLKGRKHKLSQGKGTHSIMRSGDYYVDTYSRMGVPYRVTLHELSGKEVRLLKDNTPLEQRYRAMGLVPPRFMEIPGADGTPLNAWYLEPYPDFASPAPLLMFVYGGPGSQQVKDGWTGANYGWFQYLAKQGIAVACVDNRGTGARGKKFRTVTYGRLGELETQDQLAAARYLGNKPEIDASRIGIFGWSYGGYMSSLCILKGSGVFKAAIAVAPVTNWKYYDSIYTERYMGTTESNPDGFDRQSPITIADRLEGDYLLVHGTGDDNVHWQNSAEMINALVAVNKPFEQFMYPDRNHGIYGGNTRLHLYTLMSKFLMNSFGMNEEAKK